MLRSGADIEDIAKIKKEDVNNLSYITEIQAETGKARDVKKILEELHVNPEDAQVILNQLKTLDAFTAMGILQKMIKAYNVGVKDTGSKEVNEISISEIKKNKKDFLGKSANDLQNVWNTLSNQGDLSQNTQNFLDKVQTYADELDGNWLTSSKEERTLKKELNNNVKELKEKELRFSKDTEIINNFVNTHYDRAKDAANFLDRLQNLNNIINSKENISKAQLVKAKKEKRELLSEEGHHFIDGHPFIKHGGYIVGGLGLLATVLLTGAFVAAAIVISSTVIATIIGTVTVCAGAALSYWAGSYVHKNRDLFLQDKAQAQLNKSNDVLSATVGQRLLRAGENIETDKTTKEQSIQVDGVKVVINDSTDLKSNNLKLVKLKNIKEGNIKSTKLKGISGGGKTLKHNKDETIISTYTKKYLEDTNKLKKNLLQSLGDLSSDPSHALKPSETSNTEKSDLMKGAFR